MDELDRVERRDALAQRGVGLRRGLPGEPQQVRLEICAQGFQFLLCCSLEFSETGFGQQLRADRPVQLVGLQLLDHTKAADALQNEVVAPIAEPLVLADATGAADRIDLGRLARTGGLTQKNHSDDAVLLERVSGHLTVARLEDVERELGAGEQNHVGQWEDWERRRQVLGSHALQGILQTPPRASHATGFLGHPLRGPC